MADEACKDGQIDERENRILRKLAQFLRLGDKEALELVRASKARFDQGKLGAARPLSPMKLYAKVLYHAHKDGQLEEAEEIMLEGMRRLFGIQDDDHARALAEVLEQLGRG